MARKTVAVPSFPLKDFEKAIETAKEALLLEPDNKDVKDEIAEYEEAFEKWKKEKTK